MNEADRIKRKECVDLYLILTEKIINLDNEIAEIDKRIGEIDAELGFGQSNSYNRNTYL